VKDDLHSFDVRAPVLFVEVGDVLRARHVLLWFEAIPQMVRAAAEKPLALPIVIVLSTYIMQE
jgi:hypothetical protein